MKHSLLDTDERDEPATKRSRSPNPQSAGSPSERNRPVQSVDGQVCARCSSLDLDDLFAARRTENTIRHIVTLGKLDASSCSVCRLFHEVRTGDEGSESGDGEYDLYAISAIGPFLYAPGSVLAVVNKAAHKTLLRHCLVTGTIPDDRGLIASAASDKSAAHPGALAGRRISSNSTDYTVLASWLRTCEHLHKKTCVKNLESTKRPFGFKLVDCISRRVIHEPPPCSYVALSYVWGAYQYATFERPTDDKIPDDLPTTVEDAFKVSAALGLRYVWIDRYCIDQDDESVKIKQIGEMDLVYRGAYLTIIAAAGSDVYFGLPGVSSRARSAQPEAWLGDHRLVSILPDPTRAIQESTWMRRMWVYQESVFSSRRLVFTEQQVYFECRAGIARESIDYFTDSEGTNIFSSSHRDEQKPWGIMRHLGQYCGREISFDSDVLRAFQGVYHDFETRKPPTYSHFGVPVFPPAVRGKSGGVKAVKRSCAEGFLAGLCWRGDGPGKRRPGYPSWSWAGWTSPVEGWCQEAERGLRLDNETPIVVHAESRDGNSVDFVPLKEYKKIADGMSSFVHVQAWTISLDVQYLAAPPEWMDGFFQERRWSRNISGHFAVFEDDETLLQVAMYSLRHKYDGARERVYASETDGGEVIAIVLGRCEDVSDLEGAEGIFMMVVQEKGDHFERVGHMEFKRGYMRTVSKSSQEETETELPWQLCFRNKQRRTIRLG